MVVCLICTFWALHIILERSSWRILFSSGLEEETFKRLKSRNNTSLNSCITIALFLVIRHIFLLISTKYALNLMINQASKNPQNQKHSCHHISFSCYKHLCTLRLFRHFPKYSTSSLLHHNNLVITSTSLFAGFGWSGVIFFIAANMGLCFGLAQLCCSAGNREMILLLLSSAYTWSQGLFCFCWVLD